MSEVGGSELSDVSQDGTEFKPQTPAPKTTSNSLSPQGIAAIQGVEIPPPATSTTTTNEQAPAVQTLPKSELPQMTLEQKATLPTPTDVLTPKGIGAIQGKV